MDYVKLGRTGLEVSRIGLGCMSYGVPERGIAPWSLNEEESRPFIKRALELGINFFDTANTAGIGVIPWSPLAKGRLTREWDEQTARSEIDEAGQRLVAAMVDADRNIVERVAEVAAKRGIPRAQVALAWVLQKEPVTAPIVGATKPNHLEDAVAALSVKLDANEIASLEEPYVPHQIYGI